MAAMASMTGTARGMMHGSCLPRMVSSAFSPVFSETVSHSYGLRNVHNRLRLRWGEGYGLTLESIEDEGCTVTARLPLLSERNDSSHG